MGVNSVTAVKDDRPKIGEKLSNAFEKIKEKTNETIFKMEKKHEQRVFDRDVRRYERELERKAKALEKDFGITTDPAIIEAEKRIYKETKENERALLKAFEDVNESVKELNTEM